MIGSVDSVKMEVKSQKKLELRSLLVQCVVSQVGKMQTGNPGTDPCRGCSCLGLQNQTPFFCWAALHSFHSACWFNAAIPNENGIWCSLKKNSCIKKGIIKPEIKSHSLCVSQACLELLCWLTWAAALCLCCSLPLSPGQVSLWFPARWSSCSRLTDPHSQHKGRVIHSQNIPEWGAGL